MGGRDATMVLLDENGIRCDGSGFTKISNFSPSKEYLTTVTSTISKTSMIIWYLSIRRSSK